MRNMHEINSLSKIVSSGLIVFASMLTLNCGNPDTRNLPSKIKATAVASDGYHVHAKVEYYSSSPIKFICTGVFGEGLKEKTSTFNDISKEGVEFEIKKNWSGVCGYQFAYLEVACTKTMSFPNSHDDSFESVNIGILDTLNDQNPRRGNTIKSENRILDNFLFIKVDGGKSHFWGCKDDCENGEKFGLNSSNTTLTIKCEGN